MSFVLSLFISDRFFSILSKSSFDTSFIFCLIFVISEIICVISIFAPLIFPIDFSSYVPDSTSLIKNFPEIFEVEDLNEEEK